MNRLISLGLLVALTGCGLDSSNDQEGASGGDDGSGSGGAFPSPCALTLNATPASPVAGANATVTVLAQLGDIPGAFTPAWTVMRDGAAISVQVSGDGRAIQFATPDPGVYDIALVLTGAPASCSTASRALTVANPLGGSVTLRLRVLAPQRYTAAPLELFTQLRGGVSAQDVGLIVMPMAGSSNVQVVDAGGHGVPAYVQLAPAGTPDAIVEAFTDGTGSAAVPLNGGVYNALVVPSDGASAPRRIAGWSGGPLTVTAGQAITGVVSGPDGKPLPGAQVQLTFEGLPSTIATTDAAGSFAVHAQPPAGAAVTIDVAPPEATGLPRL
ncbi:MAG TPA: carboxypeptidase-like regulatory domain-containing protein, partial [Kofleriaceae bacterium]